MESVGLQCSLSPKLGLGQSICCRAGLAAWGLTASCGAL